jgi:hypothetical protein
MPDDGGVHKCPLEPCLGLRESLAPNLFRRFDPPFWGTGTVTTNGGHMLLILLLILLFIAIGGGIVISKFLFLVLIVVVAVALVSRMGGRSSA